MKTRLERMSKMVAAILAIGTLAHAPAFAGNDYRDSIRSRVVPQVQSWLANPLVVSAIRAQNRNHSGLTQSEIADLDSRWRSETSTGGGTLIDSILGNQLSKYLSGVKNDGEGIYTEIFVMDNKGLNVGQSDITSDYWQGDEAKWKKTYLSGADSMLIDDVEFDESSQTFQSQLSLPVVDPATNEVIGAVTVGVNVELLQ